MRFFQKRARIAAVLAKMNPNLFILEKTKAVSCVCARCMHYGRPLAHAPAVPGAHSPDSVDSDGLGALVAMFRTFSYF